MEMKTSLVLDKANRALENQAQNTRSTICQQTMIAELLHPKHLASFPRIPVTAIGCKTRETLCKILESSS